ncbi:MAG: hypothetical protein ACLRSW_14610 [Christensenellaceae bacterium]
MQLSEYEVAEDMLIDGLKIVQTRGCTATSDSYCCPVSRAKAGDKVADFARAANRRVSFLRAPSRLRDWIYVV